jgi:hypothetical protein
MSLGTPLPAIYWATDKVGGPESRSLQQGNLSLVSYKMEGLFELP